MLIKIILYIACKKQEALSIRTLLYGLAIIRGHLPPPYNPTHSYRRAQHRSYQISELGEKKSRTVGENLTQRVLLG